MRIDEVQPHTPFVVTDYWSTDPAFQHALARQFSDSPQGHQLWPELAGRLAVTSRMVQDEVRPLARLCDRPNTAPRLVQFNEWGQRIDRVETSEGWRGLLRWQCAHGMVGESFGAEGQEEVVHSERHSAGGRDRLGDLARLYNFARIFMISPDSQVSFCPTSMTDGAVRVLELYGTPAQKRRYLPKLMARNIDEAWLAGQWMTEVAGGSDVSMTETVAQPLMPRAAGQKANAGDLFVVRGFKWFSSAVDGNMSLALARTDPDRRKGSKGLSLFLIPLHKKDRPDIPHGAQYVDETAATSKFNGIKVHRLKNKLGTHHVPTAELELCGAVAELIGEEGRGVAQIAQVLNITRIYSTTGSVSSVGRSLHILQSYSGLRQVGVHGQPTLLKDIAMHNALVAKVAIHYRAMLQLLWTTTRLLGKSEAGTSSAAQERRLRLLTPVGKAFSAVRASDCISQCIECMGGQGYMQENPLTAILRDDFVGRIWEGTPSVLSLDTARVHMQTKGVALSEWRADCLRDIQQSQTQLEHALGASAPLSQTVKTLRDTLQEIDAVYLTGKALLTAQDDMRLARPLLELIAIVESGCQLLNQSAWSTQTSMPHGEAQLELQVASRWVCGPEGGLLQTRATLQGIRQGKLQEQAEVQIAYGIDVNAALANAGQGVGLMRGARSLPEVGASLTARPKL